MLAQLTVARGLYLYLDDEAGDRDRCRLNGTSKILISTFHKHLAVLFSSRVLFRTVYKASLKHYGTEHHHCHNDLYMHKYKQHELNAYMQTYLVYWFVVSRILVKLILAIVPAFLCTFQRNKKIKHINCTTVGNWYFTFYLSEIEGS